MSKKKEITPEEMKKDLETRFDNFLAKIKQAEKDEQVKLFAHLKFDENGIVPVLGLDDLKYKK